MTTQFVPTERLEVLARLAAMAGFPNEPIKPIDLFQFDTNAVFMALSRERVQFTLSYSSLKPGQTIVFVEGMEFHYDGIQDNLVGINVATRQTAISVNLLSLHKCDLRFNANGWIDLSFKLNDPYSLSVMQSEYPARDENARTAGSFLFRAHDKDGFETWLLEAAEKYKVF